MPRSKKKPKQSPDVTMQGRTPDEAPAHPTPGPLIVERRNVRTAQMSAAERGIFVRGLAAVMLRWAVAELEREQADVPTVPKKGGA